MTIRTSNWAKRLALSPAIAVVLCGASRLAYLLSPKAQFNADEATTGVMVAHILRGESFTFFAGQDYGGTVEQYLQAGFYWVSRLPQNPLTLRLPQVALSMLTCALVYLVAARMLPTRTQATYAALLFAVGPWFNVILGATSLGFYAASQALCMLLVYSCLRLTDDSDNSRWLALAGLSAGLAVWTNAASVYFLVPAFVWLIPTLGRVRRRWALASLGFLAGAAPLVVWLLAHRRLPLPSTPEQASSPLGRLHNLGNPVLREYVGVSFAHGRGGLPIAVQVIVVLSLVAAYILVLWRRRGLRDLLTLNTVRRRPFDLILAIPPVVIVAYAASSSTWYTGTPRYLFITYPAGAIAAAAVVPAWRGARRALVMGTALTTTAVLTLAFFLTKTVSPTLHERDVIFGQVIDYLQSRQVSAVYAGYWTAIPLHYRADGKLMVAVCNGVARFPAAQLAAASSTAPVYVASALDGPSDSLEVALRQHQMAFRVTTIGFVRIYETTSAVAAPIDC